MIFKINKIIALLLLSAVLAACGDNKSKQLTVGIIEPLEHTAMNEIVEGFRISLQKQYDKPVIIKVENAQNDLNLQRAIIQKMKDANYDVIVPIGTGASQMAVSMTPKQNMVSLASNLTEDDRAKLKECHLSIVHDEISSKEILSFVKKVYPNMKNIILIHSAAEKVLPEVEAAIVAGKALGITIHHRMVTSLSELYSVSRALSSDYDGMFVLKDSLIVSGASTLAQIAKQKKIPLIASDEGSVKAGADIALGVREKQIGVEGGTLVASILKGKNACQLPIVEMTALSVFLNPSHEVIKANVELIKQTANTLHYAIETIDSNKAM